MRVDNSSTTAPGTNVFRGPLLANAPKPLRSRESLAWVIRQFSASDAAITPAWQDASYISPACRIASSFFSVLPIASVTLNSKGVYFCPKHVDLSAVLMRLPVDQLLFSKLGHDMIPTLLACGARTIHLRCFQAA
jgi:hypothetical protein